MIFSKSFHGGFELGKELADYRRLGTPDQIERALNLCEEEISKLKAELARAKKPELVTGPLGSQRRKTKAEKEADKVKKGKP